MILQLTNDLRLCYNELLIAYTRYYVQVVAISLLLSTVISFIVLRSFIIPSMGNYDKRNRVILISSSLIFSSLLILIVPFTVSGQRGLVYGSLYSLGALFALFVLMLSISLLLLRGITNDKPKNTGNVRRAFFLSFLPCVVMWTIYLLAFYPGNMSPDSIAQWREMVTFTFVDWHPVFHTLLNWLLTRIWFSPAIIGIFQIVFLSSVFAFGIAKLYKENAPLFILIGVTLFYVILPINGSFAITLWKDIPYSISLLWLTLLLIDITESDGRWLLALRNMAILTFIFVCIILFRHNGILPVVGTLSGMVLFLRDKWKNILLISVMTLLVVFSVKVPLYKALHVKTNVYENHYFLLAHQISAVVHGDGEITDSQREFLDNILPFPLWKENYDKYSSDKLVSDPENPLAWNFVRSHQKEFFNIWGNIAIKNLNLVMEHQLACASLVWRISQPVDDYPYAIPSEIYQNELGLEMTSIIPNVKQLIVVILLVTSSPVFNWFFVRPALYLFISVYFCFLLMYRTGTIRKSLPVFPLIFNSIGVFLTIPVQDVRYMYSAMLIAPFMVPYFFLSAQKGHQKKPSLMSSSGSNESG